LDGMVYGTDTEQLGDLAKFPQRADVGRLCGVDLLYCLSPVLVYRFSSGFSDPARPGNYKGQKISARNLRPWLSWLESALASLRNGVSPFGRAFHAAGPFGAQCRIVRLRQHGFAHVAHYHLPALLRCRRDLRRLRHGADSSITGPRDLQIAGC